MGILLAITVLIVGIVFLGWPAGVLGVPVLDSAIIPSAGFLLVLIGGSFLVYKIKKRFGLVRKDGAPRPF